MTTTAAPGAGPTTPSPLQRTTLHDTGKDAKPFKRRRPWWVMPLTLVGVLLAVTMAMTLLNPGGQKNGVTISTQPTPAPPEHKAWPAYWAATVSA